LRHIEFFHSEHFEKNYYRVPPPAGLGQLIDFFWETRFEDLWKEYPKGFSDAQFPNIGYTYIFNLGTPGVMQVEDRKTTMRTDGFLPRYHAIESHHHEGDHLMGIKFRVSPVIFEKKIDFSEYKGFIFPLSYLMDPKVTTAVKKAKTFEERIAMLSSYFLSLVTKYEGSLQPIEVVSRILDKAFQQNNFSLSLEKEAARYHISARTLQRHFESCTGIGGKQALQVMRIRKAVADLFEDPKQFNSSKYGYYDHSHFYKHLKAFLDRNTFRKHDLHLQVLKMIGNE
jgi:AraC-like DNA-binding protein